MPIRYPAGYAFNPIAGCLELNQHGDRSLDDEVFIPHVLSSWGFSANG
ncbi:hypothetical protein [Moorena sp. SIO3H5]|nr:hypothetical protein [Moorena sp. SIO3H5]NEO71383.1 hypothetical protein [Moorena sp. SIO3H5]